MQPQYVATFSEKPAVLDGHPFVVEAGVSLGGTEVSEHPSLTLPPRPSCTCTPGALCATHDKRSSRSLTGSCSGTSCSLPGGRPLGVFLRMKGGK